VQEADDQIDVLDTGLSIDEDKQRPRLKEFQTKPLPPKRTT
jgi:hypothetical protein